MDPTTSQDFLALLQEMSPEELAALFQPFQQEQNVLNQQMELAQQARQPGREHSSPMGALLGGMSNAVGNVGGAAMQAKGLGEQRALGGRMQQDATGRLEALLRRLKQQQGRPGSYEDLAPATMLGYEG